MLLGMLSILAISTQIYSNEREQVLNNASSGAVLNRITSLIKVLDMTPTSLHHEIINASQGRGFIISLEAMPLIMNNKRSDLVTELKNKLEDKAADNIQDIRIVSVKLDNEDMMKRMRHKHPDMQAKMRMNMRNGTHRNIKLSGSILLSDNNWLNFSSSVDMNKRKIPLPTLLYSGLSMLIVLLIMAWIIKRALKPVKTLAIAARKTGLERDFSEVPVKGPSEIIPTIIAFNTMQKQLSTFIDDRTKMLAAISHDLRTPITSLRLRLEFIEEGPDQQQMLSTIRQMEDMLKATLNFAKEDSQQEPKQNIELISLLQTISDDYLDRGENITLVSPDKLAFRVWPSAFRRVIENLVNNSLCYGKNAQGIAEVTINCQQTDRELVINISDKGEGIDESELAEVMKPFVRLDKARDTTDSSVGLGLAISKSIVQSHGGTLVLSNLSAGGLNAEIRLPLV